MSTNEVKPPLHRRFDEATALRLIQKRYENCKKWLPNQVKELQQYEAFRRQCKGHYARGYKDWIILGAIYNLVLNWRAEELGL